MPHSSNHTAMSPIERVKITSDLSAKIKDIDSSKGLDRIKLAKSISELVARLTGSKIAAIQGRFFFSLADKQKSIESLSQYLKSGMKSLTRIERVYEAQVISELSYESGARELAAEAIKASEGEMLSTIAMSQKNAAQVDAFNHLHSKGVKVDIDPDAILKKTAEIDAKRKSGAILDPAYSALKKVYDAASDEYLKTADRLYRERAVIVQTNQNGYDSDAFREKLLEIEKLNADWSANGAKMRDEVNALSKAFYASIDIEKQNALGGVGQDILDRIALASPVTREQASEWAKKQVIDKGAAEKMKRLGYSAEQAVKDMADFYLLTGGKSSAIRLSLDGKKRANAVGIETRVGEKIINLGSRFDRTVLFHELAHHMESDPLAMAASNGFLLKRRQSDQLFRLDEMTGHYKKDGGYDPHEVAYKDSFIDHYIGRCYVGSDITEVFSMGLQYLSSPESACLFAAKDPEMFAMITGYITSKLTPAMRAKVSMHETAISDLSEAKKTEDQVYDEAIKVLSEKVSIVDDGWSKVAYQRNDVRGLLPSYTSSMMQMPDYIGAYAGYRISLAPTRTMRPAETARHIGSRNVMAETRRRASGFRKIRPFTDRLNWQKQSLLFLKLREPGSIPFSSIISAPSFLKNQDAFTDSPRWRV